MIYLRARYYDSATARMLSEDTYWNSSNMISGDDKGKNCLLANDSQGIIFSREKEMRGTIKRQQVITKHIEDIYANSNISSDEKIKEANRWFMGQLKDEEKNKVEIEIKGIIVPSTEAIMQSSNLYSYCMNNPTKYIDPSGLQVFAVAYGASAQCGLRLEVAFVFVWDDKGNCGIAYARGWGAGFLSASVGVSVIEFPDMDNIYDFEGQANAVGIQGFEKDFAGGKEGYTIPIPGPGITAGIDLHGSITWTTYIWHN